MNKKPLTTIVTHLLRGAVFLALLFIAINMIRLAQGQKESSSRPQTNSDTSLNNLRSGGTLNPVAFINPTTVNASGRVAFNSQVDGSDRNQGVFVADSDGTISAITIGCGGLGGGGDTTSNCGDASPIGGHFGGFFFGTSFTPDINDARDVLFFCDVNRGTSRPVPMQTQELQLARME